MTQRSANSEGARHDLSQWAPRGGAVRGLFMSREGKIGQSAAGPGRAGGSGPWGTGWRWELRAGVWFWLRAGLGCATQARWPGLAWSCPAGLSCWHRRGSGARPRWSCCLRGHRAGPVPPPWSPRAARCPVEALGLCGSRRSIASGPRKGLSEPRARRGKRLFVAALPQKRARSGQRPSPLLALLRRLQS